MKNINSPILHPDLELINEHIFKGCGLQITNLVTEPESKEYAAHHFQLNGLNVVYREAKITPTKTGQFVTIWKRNKEGITTPFDISDDNDLYLIAAKKDTHSGIFIFPKAVLYHHKILSGTDSAGKRGTRLYASWDLVTSKQAQKTKDWQVDHFLEFTSNQFDLNKAKELLAIKIQ
ncbi:MAG: MepB family protein [Ferruginibacter sp.]